MRGEGGLGIGHRAPRSSDRVGTHQWRALRATGPRLRELGRWKGASADHSKAIDLEPEDATHWIDRGDVYAELELWDRASADYSKAAELGDWKWQAITGLAKVKLAKNDADTYRKACDDLLGKINRDDKTGDDISVAWTCVLAPDAVAEWAAVEVLAGNAALARRPATTATNSSLTGGPRPIAPASSRRPSGIWTKGSRLKAREAAPAGLALYGHGPSATGPYRRGTSMAGQSDQLDRFLPRDKPKDDTLGTRIDWRTWLALQVLRRKAEALIKGSKPDAPRGRP